MTTLTMVSATHFLLMRGPLCISSTPKSPLSSVTVKATFIVVPGLETESNVLLSTSGKQRPPPRTCPHIAHKCTKQRAVPYFPCLNPLLPLPRLKVNFFFICREELRMGNRFVIASDAAAAKRGSNNNSETGGGGAEERVEKNYWRKTTGGAAINKPALTASCAIIAPS